MLLTYCTKFLQATFCWYISSKREAAVHISVNLDLLNRNTVLKEALRTHLQQAASQAEQLQQKLDAQTSTCTLAEQALHNVKVSLLTGPCYMFTV